MAKSRGRKFAELVAPANGVFAAASIPTIAISKLATSTFSVNSESASLGGNVVIDSNDVTEHTNALYFTNARADARITAASLLPLAGGTMTGNLTLGDNVNAYFGASTDLRIYHDGTNSHIINSTGELRITGSNIAIKSDSNKLYLGAGDDLKIYHDGSNSYIEDAGTGSLILKGGTISVNGAFTLPTSDGSANQILQTDGSGAVSWVTNTGGTSYWAQSGSNIYYTSGSVGIGTNSPNSWASYTDSAATVLQVEDSSQRARIVINGGNGAHLDLVDYAGGTDDKHMNIAVDGGILKFGSLNDAGSAFVQNNIAVMDLGLGNVGLGISSPAFRLHAYHATTNVVARFESGDSEVWIDLHDSDSGNYGALLGHDSTNLFKVANASAENRLALGNTGILLATGGFEIADSNTRISEGAGNSIRITTDSGTVDIGPMNTTWCHFQTDRGKFYFQEPVHFDGPIYNYASGGTTEPYWHAGTNFTSSNILTVGQVKLGDGNDGVFYSDTNGRTAFGHGDFYIQNTVTNYYNYANNQYIGDTSGDNIYFRGNTLSGTGWQIEPYKFTTSDIQLYSGYVLMRTSHHSGHLEGSYNNVGANGGKSNPIYTIGSSYNPSETTLGDMYGIGYANSGQSNFITSMGTGAGWGLYVASDGDARIFLDAQNGTTHASGASRAYSFKGHSNVASTADASYHPSGIYSTGNNWLYGNLYLNGNGINFTGGSIASCNDIVCDQNYGRGVVGAYSPSVYQHVWSMGTSYRLAANGVSSGNGGTLYGLAFSYNPNYGYTGSNAQSRSGLDHQLLLMMNGVTKAAIGNGVWTAGNVQSYSDRRVKTNIEVIPDAVSKVKQLSGYVFDRTDVEEDPATGETNPVRQTGVIAQEVLEVLPEAVMGTDEEGYSVAYGNMVGLLIEAIKEQQGQIEGLKQEIQTLKEAK